MDQIQELAPVREQTEDFAALEREIKKVFREKLYYKLLDALGFSESKLSNAKSDFPLRDALRANRITFSHGVFSGNFSAGVSKELKDLGATWDGKTKTFRIQKSGLPPPIQREIDAAHTRFKKTLERLDKEIRQILPADIAEAVKSEKFFDSSLWKVDRKIGNTLESISVLPKLTPERAKKISTEWRDNMQLWISDFAKKEITELRDLVQKQILSGGRFEDMIDGIQTSYGVTQRKAHFLARQETNLLMAKFKSGRYQEAGVPEYKWKCVAGSKNHPVRPSHKILDGKIFRWDDPPITTPQDQATRRNNPGEDYNCRCFAIPVVRKKDNA